MTQLSIYFLQRNNYIIKSLFNEGMIPNARVKMRTVTTEFCQAANEYKY